MHQALTAAAVVALLAAALQGCTIPYPARFAVNGTQYTLSEDQAWQLRKRWTDPTDEVVVASRTTGYDRSFIFSFIAHAYTVTLPQAQRCSTIALTGVRRLPLDEIVERGSAGAEEVLRPVYYAELWQVEGCGRRETWRVVGMWSAVHVRRMVPGDA